MAIKSSCLWLLLSLYIISNVGCVEGVGDIHYYFSGYNNTSEGQSASSKKNISRYCEFSKKRFDYRWWSFYTRGVCRVCKGELTKAEQDFRKALKQKKGEEWDAEMYGYHYMNYFPFRELGIALYAQGKLKEAEEKLQRSLDLEDSARAKYYLEKTRRKIAQKLQQSIKSNDSDAVEYYLEKPINKMNQIYLSIDTLKNKKFHNKQYLDIEGLVESDGYIKSVQVSIHLDSEEEYKESVFRGVPNKKIRFRKVIPIKPGENKIKLYTNDLIGRSKEEEYVVYGDFTNPYISINKCEIIKEGLKDYVFIDGKASDNYKLSALFFNNNNIPINDNYFHIKQYIDDADQQLILKVEDVSGNYNIVSLSPTTQRSKTQKSRNRLTASLETDMIIAKNGNNNINSNHTEDVDEDSIIVIEPVFESKHGDTKNTSKTLKDIMSLSESDSAIFKTYFDSVKIRFLLSSSYDIRFKGQWLNKSNAKDKHIEEIKIIENEVNEFDLRVVNYDKNIDVFNGVIKIKKINPPELNSKKSQVKVCFNSKITSFHSDEDDKYYLNYLNNNINNRIKEIFNKFERFNFCESCDQDNADWFIRLELNLKFIDYEHMKEGKQESTIGVVFKIYDNILVNDMLPLENYDPIKVVNYIIRWGENKEANSYPEIDPKNIEIDPKNIDIDPKDIDWIPEYYTGILNNKPPIKRILIYEYIKELFNAYLPIEEGFVAEPINSPKNFITRFPRSDYTIPNRMRLAIRRLNYSHEENDFIGPIIGDNIIRGFVKGDYRLEEKKYKSSILEKISEIFPDWWVSTL